MGVFSPKQLMGEGLLDSGKHPRFRFVMRLDARPRGLMATEAQRGSPVKLVASNVDAGLWHFTMGLPNSSKRASDNNGKETRNHNSIYGIRITEKKQGSYNTWIMQGI